MNLRITPESVISVSAPLGMNILKIDEFVAKHIDWIKEMLEKNERVLAARSSHPGQDEEWILFEGEVFPVVIDDEQENVYIALQDDYFLMQLSLPQEEVDIPATILNWRKKKSLEIFTEFLKMNFGYFADLGFDFPIVKTQKMKSRWGSYSKNTHTIKLNTELLKTPPLCIKLIIIHELCHLVYYNHGRDFYRLHRELMPDYKAGEQLLKDFCREWQVL